MPAIYTNQPQSSVPSWINQGIASIPSGIYGLGVYGVDPYGGGGTSISWTNQSQS